MRASRPSVASAGAAACAAVALWLSFGALSFVDVTRDAAYVGVLPPLLWLAALLLAAGIFTIAVRPLPHSVAPLWLSAVVILPWLPLPLPLSVFIWTGNLLLWLWLAIAAALLAPLLARLWRSSGLAGMAPRRAGLLAGVLTTVAYGLGVWSVSPQHPDGDEPHYLVIAQSLIEDRDLKIENNHVNGGYRVYFPRALKPDFLLRGTDGQIYSIHAPGLPALIAPAFLALGYRGVVAALVVLAGLAGALAWLVAWLVTRDAAASWFGWAAVALSVPVFFHAGAVFPDGPGAALLLLALLPVVDPRRRSARSLAVAGAALAMLPWLHTRFAVLALSAALVIVGRVVTDRSHVAARLAAFAVCPAASAISWFLFFQIIYGTPDPSVVYGGATDTEIRNMVRGVPGLLFDQQFGLILNAPVYLCVFAGFFVMFWRGLRRLALELLVVTVPYCVAVSSYYMWWGGTAAPARFLVPITLLLVVPMAVWFSSAKSIAARTISLAALVVSLLMTATIASVGRGAYAFNFRDGMSRVALWLSPVVNLSKAVPSLFQNPPPTVVMQTALWLAAIASGVAVGMWLNRRGRAAVILGFGLTLQIATMVAVSLVWRSNHAMAMTPASSGAAVLRRFDPGTAQLALAYRPLRRLPLAKLPGRIVLARTLSTTSSLTEWSGMTRLPAGTYEITGDVIKPASGRIRVTTDRLSPPIADWDVQALAAPWRRELIIPVAVTALHIEADAEARRVVRNLSVRAVSLWGDEDRFADDAVARYSARYGPATVFLIGGTAWVEPIGTWVGGSHRAKFLIFSSDASVIYLFVRNGPVANRATLSGTAWRQDLSLAAGEERILRVPFDARGRRILLDVQSAGGFRPSDVDPKSQDERFLGVWIETR